MGILSVLWAVVVILFVFWLVGLLVHIGGALIHLLLIIAVVIAVYNLFMHMRSRRSA